MQKTQNRGEASGLAVSGEIRSDSELRGRRRFFCPFAVERLSQWTLKSWLRFLGSHLANEPFSMLTPRGRSLAGAGTGGWEC